MKSPFLNIDVRTSQAPIRDSSRTTQMSKLTMASGLLAALWLVSSSSVAASVVSATDSISIEVASLDRSALPSGAYSPLVDATRQLTYSAFDFGTGLSVEAGESGSLTHGIANLSATGTGESLSLDVPSAPVPAGFVSASIGGGYSEFTLAPHTEVVIADTYALSLSLNNEHASSFMLEANVGLWGEMVDADGSMLQLPGSSPSDSVDAAYGSVIEHDGTLYLTFDNPSSLALTGLWQEGMSAQTYGLMDIAVVSVPEPRMFVLMLFGLGLLAVSPGVRQSKPT